MTPLPALLLLAALGAATAGAAAAEEAPTFRQLAAWAKGHDARLTVQHYIVEASRENANIRRAVFYPQVQFVPSVNSTQQRGGGSAASSDFAEYALQVNLSLVDVKARYDYLSAVSGTRTQEYRRDSALQQVYLDSIRTRLDIHTAEDEHRLTQQQLAAMQNQLEQVQARAREGIAPKLEVTLTEAEVATLRTSLEATAAQLAQLREALHKLTGARVGKLPPLREDFRFPPLPPLEEFIAAVMESNLELRGALEALAASRHLESAAAGERYPRLTAQGIHSEYSSDRASSNIAVALTIPVFRGGALLGAQRQAAAQRLAQAHTVTDIRRQLREHVRNLYRSAGSIVRRDASLKKEIASRRAVLEKTRLAWKEGLYPAQRVIDAEQLLFASERSQRALYYQYLSILAQLQFASAQLNDAFLRRLDSFFVNPPLR